MTHGYGDDNYCDRRDPMHDRFDEETQRERVEDERRRLADAERREEARRQAYWREPVRPIKVTDQTTHEPTAEHRRKYGQDRRAVGRAFPVARASLLRTQRELARRLWARTHVPDALPADLPGALP